MNARKLYQSGQLGAAIQSLGAELRDNPTVARRRTFFFELLCFAGEFDRAEKHLDVIAEAGADAATGALLYRAAMAIVDTLVARKDQLDKLKALVEGLDKAGFGSAV